MRRKDIHSVLANNKVGDELAFCVRPTAMPSKMACRERASMTRNPRRLTCNAWRRGFIVVVGIFIILF